MAFSNDINNFCIMEKKIQYIKDLINSSDNIYLLKQVEELEVLIKIELKKL